jgi:hypothetical protein
MRGSSENLLGAGARSAQDPILRSRFIAVEPSEVPRPRGSTLSAEPGSFTRLAPLPPRLGP